MTKMDSIKQGVMRSTGPGRRSGLKNLASLPDGLKDSSHSAIHIGAVEQVGGEYQEVWMEVYNQNVVGREPIDPEKYEDFVWRRLLLMQDVKGYLLLHHACRRKATYETVKWLIGDDETDAITLSHRCKEGNLPIHIACRAFASFDVVQLVSKDSDGKSYINATDGNGRRPLDIFGSGASKGKQKSTRSSAMTNFTEDMFLHFINDTETDRLQVFMAMDSICNNCPPKKFQTIVCDNLDNKICIQWLTWAFCQPKVVASIMRDFYFKLGWTAILMRASTLYVQGEGTYYAFAYSLYFFALVFLIREIKQIRRYVKAEVLVDYAREIWNWLDVTVICLVITSATILLLSDPDEPYNDGSRTILMMTVTCQIVHFASFLKKIFLPFATFVGGIVMVFKTLVPFVVCTALVLLLFAFLYHVEKFDRYNPLPPDHLQFDNLWVSFLSVFQMFVNAQEETTDFVDVFFGILTTIILLNVVIAIISIEWQLSTEEEKALRVFWEYRLTFIQDVTLSSKFEKSAKKVKKLLMLDLISNRFDQARSERIERFNDPSTKNGIGLYFFFVFQYGIFLVLGFFSFGYLWPHKIRKDIFGVKFRPPRVDTKLEIIETRKVHDTVTKRMDELESKLSKQTTDSHTLVEQNKSLVEQNKSLHKKIDHLESSIIRLTAVLAPQLVDAKMKESAESTDADDIVTEGVTKSFRNPESEESDTTERDGRALTVLQSGQITPVRAASDTSGDDIDDSFLRQFKA